MSAPIEFNPNRTHDVMMSARTLNEDERALLAHCSMYGSDGWPISKIGSHRWSWCFRSLYAPVVFKTRREAVESFEAFTATLRDLHAAESYRRALSEREARLALTGESR